jgi:Fe-S cluster assembly protein SufD
VLRINGLVAENANLHVFNLQSGLGRVRGEFRLTLAGTGGDLKVNQAVIAEGHTVNDTVVKMIHAAPETKSDMQTITYATDRGTAILNGLIHVKPGSSNVEAYQQARNYILSDTAYSVGYPQLEIENQEVACSHGTTMHAFDEDQLFYLASRGIDPVRGKAMILKGNMDYFFRGMNEENKERFLHLAYGRIDHMNL